MEFTTKLGDMRQIRDMVRDSCDMDHRNVLVRGECLPNLHKRSLDSSGLKRVRRVYFNRQEDDSVSKCAGKAVQLPGIDERRRRKFTHGSPHHYMKTSSVDEEKTGSLASVSENVGSKTTSESWTSGNGSTSPRRKIRVPTPISRNASFVKTVPTSFDQQMLHPRPPMIPRRFAEETNETYKSKSQTVKRDASQSNLDSTVTTDDADLPCRPHTPVPGKLTFKATLQNIHEQCTKGKLGEAVVIKNKALSTQGGAPVWTSRKHGKGCISRSVATMQKSSSTTSPTAQRRKSTGDEIPNRAKVLGRRLSMPGDLQETKRRTTRGVGVEFINVREYSRDIIQQLLIRRDERPPTRLVDDEERTKKCRSWLQSLEQSR